MPCLHLSDRVGVATIAGAEIEIRKCRARAYCTITEHGLKTPSNEPLPNCETCHIPAELRTVYDTELDRGYPWFTYPHFYEWLATQATTIVEVGSWKGFSTSHLARAMASVGREANGSPAPHLHAVDVWNNAGAYWKDFQTRFPDRTGDHLFGCFLRNLERNNVTDMVTPHRMASLTAAAEFRRKGITVDAVFIDADHSKQAVLDDIRAWSQIVRPGGILAGHDLNNSQVRAAVDELLPKQISRGDGHTWYTTLTAEKIASLAPSKASGGRQSPGSVSPPRAKTLQGEGQGEGVFSSSPILTVAMATFRDWPGLWQTLKDLRKQIARHGLQKLVRILVVDNEPDGPDGVHNAKLCTDAGARYIAMPDPVGTAPPRNRAIAESETPWTLVMDSHVDLMDDVLPQLITWCDGNQSPDLYYGPLLRFKLYEDDGTPAINWTHWKPEYGLDGMFGRTAIDARWKDPSGAPFEIPLAGSGLFLTRTASWLKWSPELRHFGVEGYIARKYRAAGRKLYCLPFLQWVHRFRPKSQTAPYPTDFLSRCRNEIVSHVEFSDPPLDQIRATFLDRARVSPTQWAKLLKEFKLKDPPKCPHKGKLLRVDPCELCGLKDQQAPVHHCSKHNVDCSPTRYQDIKAGRTLTRDCAGCHARNEDT